MGADFANGGSSGGSGAWSALGSLPLLDYGARVFVLRGFPQFTTADPLSEARPGESVFLFTGGDPVNRVDPDGREWVDAQGRAVWRNGQWTKYATPDAMRVGISMRATEIGAKMFDRVANSPAAIQIAISPEIKFGNNGKSLTRGSFTPGEGGRVMRMENGEMHPVNGTITIYEGSIKAELDGTISTGGETSDLIKSLPAETAIDGAIGSVGVHESTHITPENIKQQVENTIAVGNGQPAPHDVEAVPERNQNQYLKELSK